MGLFDSLGSLFSSGSGAASAGPSWVSMLGPLISSIHARPNAGASKGDMARANRINLLTGLFGGLATAYGARQDANAQAEANKGLFDIIAKGGGERLTEAAGPVMPGMERPTAMTKIPMSAAFAELGASNPRLQDSALKLALAAQDSEHQDLWAQKRMDLEQSRYNTEQDWRQKTFDADQAYKSASLGYQSQARADANRHWEQEFKLKQDEQNGILGQIRIAESIAPGSAQFLPGLGASPQAQPSPEVDNGQIGGMSVNRPPEAQQPVNPIATALGRAQQAKAAEKAAAVGGAAFEKVVGSKEFQELNSSYNQIGIMAASLKDNSKVSDLAFANGWAKAMKPGEGVMADDIKTTLSASGVQAGAIAQFMDVMMGVPGATLDPTTKRKLLEVAAEAVRQREAGYQNIVGAYQGQYGKTFVDPWKRPSVDVLLQQALGGRTPPLGAGGINMFDQNIPQFRSNGQRIVGWEP